MPTTWITCDIDGLQEDQVTQTQADDGSVTAVMLQTWVVETDHTTKSNPNDALSASVAGGKTLPSIGEYIGTYLVSSVLPKRKGPYAFDVQITAKWKYTPPPPATKFSVQIDFSGQKFTQDAYNDSTGLAIVNSASQSFDPTLPKTYYDERIQISYITTSDQSEAFAGVRGKVNNADVSFAIQSVSRTFPHRALLCEDVTQSASLPLGDGTATFKVVGSFTVRTDTYTSKVLDQGFYSLDSGALAPILDNSGQPIVTPARLDGSGNVLDEGDDPVYITFKMETEADFTAIFTGLA